MSPSGRVGNAAHFKATHDDVQSRLYRLIIVLCIVLGECVLALVKEQVLEMPFLEEVYNHEV